MFSYDPDKMKEAMKIFLANEHWASVYRNAPSDACRAFLAYTFYHSAHDEPAGNDARELQEALYGNMDAGDWQYLYRIFPGPFRATCQKKIDELEGRA